VVGGVRTPFIRSGTLFETLTAVELGGYAVKELVARCDLAGDEIDELIYGTVIPSVTRPNIAREVTFEAALPKKIPASSVVMACASSNRAITDAAERIALGLADVVIAGGAESLSDVPVLFSRPSSGDRGVHDRSVDGGIGRENGEGERHLA
jgi:acetyl-CoA acyltransferase